MSKLLVQNISLCLTIVCLLNAAAKQFCSAFQTQHSLKNLQWRKQPHSSSYSTLEIINRPSLTINNAAKDSSPFDNLKVLINPFVRKVEENGAAGLAPRPPSALPFTGTPDQLIAKAKEVISSDLAVSPEYSNMLDDNFVWIGAFSYGTPLGKQEYLAAGQFFNLRSTFPDLDYRAHDFRLLDANDDPYTVRVTCRAVGTMRGSLRLRTETLPPNGKRMICPPEAVSMTFDAATGKLTKLCSGFTMDRLVGNTRGLCGVMAAAVIAGKPPSEWDIYPPSVVVQRFFGRSVKQLIVDPAEEPLFAPFPESVMIQLAKGVIAADNGASAPDLLSPSFTFCGPIVGPLDKDTFVKAFGSFQLKDAFPDLDVKYTNFRVDPFDPYRVWVDVRATGTNKGPFLGKEPTGRTVETPPEAVSFTFDDDGFCTRLTAGAVLDPSLGNTGGLGGVFGIAYAIGRPLPEIVSRSIPEIIARLQKRLLSFTSGTVVDDYVLPAAQVVTPSATKIDSSPVSKNTGSSAGEAKVAAPPKVLPPLVSFPKILSSNPEDSSSKAVQKSLSASSVPKKPLAASESPKTKSTSPILIDENPTDPVTDVFKSLFGRFDVDKKTADAKVKEPSPLNKSMAAPKVSEASEAAKEAVKRKKEAAAADLKIVKAEAEAKALAAQKQKAEKNAAARAEAVSAAEKQKREQEAALVEKAKAEAQAMALDKKKKIAEQEAALKSKAAEKEKSLAKNEKVAQIVPRKTKVSVSATIKLKPAKQMETTTSKISGTATKASSTSLKQEAPKGVPVLSFWRKNWLSSTITGRVSGSPNFADGEEITTSSIAEGEIKAGNVVRTSSGSKYFLS